MKFRGLLACQTNKLVYINMPKSACTTIKNIMHFADTGEWLEDPYLVHRGGSSLMQPKNNLRKFNRMARTGDRYCFTFLRAPDRRVYSCFMEKFCGKQRPGYMAVRDQFAAEYGLNFQIDPAEDVDNHRKNFLGFLQFVGKNLAERGKVRGRGHWQRQSSVVRRNRKMPPVFIGLVENLKPHINHVLKESGVGLTLDTIPQFNETAGRSVRFDQIDNDEVQALVGEIYAKDLELYETVKQKTRHIV